MVNDTMVGTRRVMQHEVVLTPRVLLLLGCTCIHKQLAPDGMVGIRPAASAYCVNDDDDLQLGGRGQEGSRTTWADNGFNGFGDFPLVYGFAACTSDI